MPATATLNGISTDAFLWPVRQDAAVAEIIKREADAKAKEEEEEEGEEAKEEVFARTQFVLAHTAEFELKDDPAAAFNEAVSHYRIIQNISPNKDNVAKAHLRLGLLYACSPAVVMPETDRADLVLGELRDAAKRGNKTADRLLNILNDARHLLQIPDDLFENISDSSSGNSLDEAPEILYNNNNGDNVDADVLTGSTSGELTERPAGLEGATAPGVPVVRDFTEIFDTALTKYIRSDQRRHEAVRELQEGVARALAAEKLEQSAEGVAAANVQSALHSKPPPESRTSVDETKPSSKTKPSEEKTGLTLVRLLAAFEVLLRTSDLSNPALTHHEQLRRADNLLQTYKRIRKHDPNFHSEAEALKVARALANHDNYTRRKMKLAKLVKGTNSP